MLLVEGVGTWRIGGMELRISDSGISMLLVPDTQIRTDRFETRLVDDFGAFGLASNIIVQSLIGA